MVLEKTLESPLDCKEIKPANPEWSQLWILIRTEAGASILWTPYMTSRLIDTGKVEGQVRRGQQSMKWFDDIADSKDVNLSKLREMMKDG